MNNAYCNISKSRLLLLSRLMRHTLYLMLVSLFAASCLQKDKNVTPECEGYFISIFNYNSGRPYDAQEGLFFTNAEHNDGFNNSQGIVSSGIPIKGSVYNWRNHHYYFTKPVGKGTPSWEFNSFSLDLLQVNEIGQAVFEDTSNRGLMYTSMTCNTLLDIVYCFKQQDDTCKLYEVSRNGVLGIHQICVLDTGYRTWTAAVDEISGNIFLLHGRTLKKIDPNTGNISYVTTYLDTDPDILYFNNNDKMFYAIDCPGQHRLLRINPGNGELSIQGTINGLDTNDYYQVTYDRCNNQLIILQSENPPSTFYLNVYWVNLKDASLDRSVAHLWAADVVAYINDRFPEKN